MSFAECLQSYMRQAGATSAELADAAHVSRSSVSRYLSGKRVPDPSGDVPEKLARALAELSEEGKGQSANGGLAGQLDAQHADAPTGSSAGQPLDSALNVAEVQAALSQAADRSIDYATFPERLGDVLDTFGVTRNRLARSVGFDPSYISRILAGQRRPADMTRFVDDVSAYVARNYSDKAGIALAAELTGASVEMLSQPYGLAQAIRRYLGSNDDVAYFSPSSMERFLEKLDEFDLNDFLREIHFDEIKVPSAPFQLPTTKTYAGIEEMKQAELDFLKAAVMSKSTEDIILYSDMPLAEMAADDEFPKKVMTGMAMLVRKGVRLQNIHDVHRPLEELFMGLEGWIPVYMTGQITPYYLTQPTNTAFLHFMRSAGTVAISGEAIAGNQAGGRYVVTKNAADVAYYRQRANDLLARAKPLLDIYRENDFARLERVLRQLGQKAEVAPMVVAEGTFKNMKITVWSGSHALIEKMNSPKVSFVVEYPALVDALERYEPTLF